MAKVKRVAPVILKNDNPMCDLETLQSVISNRFHVLARFAITMRRTCVQEARDFHKEQGHDLKISASTFAKWLSFREMRLSAKEYEKLKTLVANSSALKRIGEMRTELASLWEDKEATTEQLIERMRNWCRRAEESNINSLKRFAYELRGFSSTTGLAT